MLLPQLHDELARAARLRPVARRARGRAVGVLLAALIALLFAAPAAHAERSLVAAAPVVALHLPEGT
jgi:hypothetical protein